MTDLRDQLGEGPIWDDQTATLLHADIALGVVHAWRPKDGHISTTNIRAEVSAVVLRASGGVLLAVGRQIVAMSRHEIREILTTVEDDMPGNRFNDCRCDPQGRLWAGTMSKARVRGAAGLYCHVAGRPIRRVITGTTVSNGIGWSPAGDRMYFVDSVTQRIDVLDFDGSNGSVSSRRPFVHIDPNDGLPDGIAVDADGGVWLCLFGGGAIRRYSERGELDEVVTLPTTNPTCPAFGGESLTTLFITTARHNLPYDQLTAEPLAGAVLALEPGVSGLPTSRFNG